MILDRQHFDLDNRCIIEKIIVSTPMRYTRIFPNEACFLHFNSGQMNLASATGKMQINASDSVLLNCGNHFADLLQHSNDKTMEVVAVHLYPDLLRKIYHTEIPPLIPRSHFKENAKTIKNTSFITQFVQGLNIYFENPALATTELLMLKIKELILLLLQSDEADTVADLFTRLFSPKEVKLKDVIQTHLFTNLSVAELAVLSGQSLSSFKREFQNIFNDSPADYIRTKRIEEAQKLLRLSKYSISEICYQVGFSDISHFSKVFKKLTGASPINFRRRSQKRKERTWTKPTSL